MKKINTESELVEELSCSELEVVSVSDKELVREEKIRKECDR